MTGVAGVAARLAFLADDTDVGDETHKGGPFAILVIAVLCIVCFFLFRSMSKHLRRVRDDFPAADTGPAADAEPAGSEDDATTGDATTADAEGGTAAARRPAAPPVPGSTRPIPRSRTGADHPAGR